MLANQKFRPLRVQRLVEAKKRYSERFIGVTPKEPCSWRIGIDASYNAST
ncbi:MAG: hypothetical protein QW056_06025 [Candidatus Bathyarchaeia archaeon]